MPGDQNPQGSPFSCLVLAVLLLTLPLGFVGGLALYLYT